MRNFILPIIVTAALSTHGAGLGAQGYSDSDSDGTLDELRAGTTTPYSAVRNDSVSSSGGIVVPLVLLALIAAAAAAN